MAGSHQKKVYLYKIVYYYYYAISRSKASSKEGVREVVIIKVQVININLAHENIPPDLIFSIKIHENSSLFFDHLSFCVSKAPPT